MVERLQALLKDHKAPFSVVVKGYEIFFSSLVNPQNKHVDLIMGKTGQIYNKSSGLSSLMVEMDFSEEKFNQLFLELAKIPMRRYVSFYFSPEQGVYGYKDEDVVNVQTIGLR